MFHAQPRIVLGKAANVQGISGTDGQLEDVVKDAGLWLVVRQDFGQNGQPFLVVRLQAFDRHRAGV